MTFEQLKLRVPEAVESEWTQHANGGGWKHITADVPDSCFLAPSAIVGDGCKLGDYCTLGNGCKLGDYCTLGNGCKLGDYCTRYTAEWWLSHYAEVGAEEGYSPEKIAEYGMLLAAVAAWLQAAQERSEG